jgi:hypothetical protein
MRIIPSDQKYLPAARRKLVMGGKMLNICETNKARTRTHIFRDSTSVVVSRCGVIRATLVVLLSCVCAIPRHAQAASTACDSARANIGSLQAKVAQDQEAIRRLGFSQQAANTQEWQNLSEEARVQLMSDAVGGLLAAAQKANSWAGSLGPPTANKAISRLRSAGINNDLLNQAIRQLGATPGKPAVAAEIKDFLNGISITKDSAMLAAAPMDREAKLTALSDVLSYFETNPTLALLAADLATTTSLIYYGYVQHKGSAVVDQLTNLSEADLRSLKRLSAQLTNDVKALNTLKLASANCAGDTLAANRPSSGEWIGTITYKRTQFGASACEPGQPRTEPDPAGNYTCKLDPVMGSCSSRLGSCFMVGWVPLEPMTYTGPVRVEVGRIGNPYNIRTYVTFLDNVARLQGAMAAHEPDYIVNLGKGSIADIGDSHDKCERRLVSSSCRLITNESVNQAGDRIYTEEQGSVQVTASTFRREVQTTRFATLRGAMTPVLIINEVISVQKP